MLKLTEKPTFNPTGQTPRSIKFQPLGPLRIVVKTPDNQTFSRQTKCSG